MSLYTFHDKILIHFYNFASTRYFHIRALNRTIGPVCNWKQWVCLLNNRVQIFMSQMLMKTVMGSATKDSK